MKGTVLKFIIFVIIPIMILLGISIYFISRIPSVKFGLTKYITDYAFDVSVKKGNLSPECAGQIKRASHRLLELSEKIEVNKLDSKKINAEISTFTTSKEFIQYTRYSSNNKLSDEEAKKIVEMLNKMANIMEKAIENEMRSN